MLNTPEVIAKIVNFVPENPERKLEIDLGEVGKNIRLVYGIYPYQQRLVVIPEEPLTGRWTRQPVLALESRDGDGHTARYPLPYAADVRALRGDLVVGILGCLAAIP